MKTVSEILRDCAFALPRSEDYDAERMSAALGGKTKVSSPFICDYLEWTVRDEGHQQLADETKEFLHNLGMGRGTGEFDFRDRTGDATVETQYQRCMWLFFAADLWDEGFRP